MRTMLRSLCILRILCRAEGPVGEPFIQSGLYLLQEALGEDLGCFFYLDRSGPRSREAFENLLSLEQEEKIAISGSPRGLVISVTERGKRFINQGGRWGPFFDVPPVRVPEDRIDVLFSILAKEAPLAPESLGTALYFVLADDSGDWLERLKQARREGRLSEEISERSVVEGYRRLKRHGVRSVKQKV
jgi:hypothetical protein